MSLDDLIRRVRAVPGLALRAAPSAAEGVDAAVNSALASGQSPDGQQWAPTKDGRRPLQNAAGNATLTRAVGATIITAVRGHYFHHNKPTRGMPRRAVVPSRLTPELEAPVRAALAAEFRKAVGR